MLVINEVKEAERIIETNKFDKLSSAIALLVRYYIQIKEFKRDIVRDEIKKFLILNHQEYDYWEKSVNKMIKKAKKFPLCNIDEIPITQKEIDVIYQAGSEKKEKILFTFLVLGKLKWMKTGKAWVNDTGAFTFKRANAETRVDDRDYIIKDFKEAGFISYAKSPMNMSIHIDFIDDENKPVLMIKDLRCLGYRWLQYKSQRYAECDRCGILFKISKKNRCYCKRCRKFKVIECIEPDCKKKFETPITTPNVECRCPECRRKHYNNWMKEYRNQNVNQH